MADYRTIADAEVDPDAPLTSSLGYAWRDNPIAIAEGATGAPRITRSAVMQPSSGSVHQITAGSGGGTMTYFTVSALTGGSANVRINIIEIGAAGGDQKGVRIYRIRNGITNQLASYSTEGVTDTTVNFNRGDMIFARAYVGGGASVSLADVSIHTGNDSFGLIVVPNATP